MNKGLRRFLAHWHRRVGVLACAFVLLLSLTGIVLNHSSEFGLDRLPIRSTAILSWYGIEPSEITSFRLGENWIHHLGGDYLYLNDRELAYCRGSLSGALDNGSNWLVACADELLLLTPAGEVIERIGAVYGLPQPLSALGFCSAGVCLRSGEKVFSVDTDQLRWTLLGNEDLSSEELGNKEQLQWSKTEALPEQQRQALLEVYAGSDITVERFLLDLHSGRLLGIPGPFVMDIAALLMIFLALSGFYMWFKARKRRLS